MSYIARRGLSTLIPPKIASPNAIGAAKDAARMDRVVNFYARLPRGAAPEVKPTGIIGRYQARYFGKNPSAALWKTLINCNSIALAHAIGTILILGYSMEYYFHLRTSPTFFWCIVQQDLLFHRPPQEPPPLSSSLFGFWEREILCIYHTLYNEDDVEESNLYHL
ncbi:F1F0 ATP synthase subunit f [Aspergillus niger CBS 101883]|uniref:Contig An11c0320, genomic contig n=2 Tax=Aspergillus niger TaxID=5061 RepID=A2QXL5_ASPNC|nr:uncharacterized protein BO96DRAFT_417505 [Aspergillus niger CBS 101883]XP_059601668.1 uncharacterized protein An11g09400 [Aspergillus niger]PYH61962.1 hypothetical protein BO96DRAFT_417505 [Aspergillus niger CBS 101883]CAK40813.1 unnamed protein product [Aspergillus niger]